MARKAYGNHATVATGSDSGDQVSKNAWNADLDDNGMLGFSNTTKTISSGAITPVDTVTIVAAESGTADNLDFITFAETQADDILFLYADAGDTITVRHNQSPSSGQSAIITTSAGSITLSETIPLILVRKSNTFYQVVENTIATGDALVANPLSQFAATTSLQLKGVISDETGSGALVFGTSPTIATPAITGNMTTTGTIDGVDIAAEETRLANTSGTNTGDESAASTSASGISELATIAELDTGTDTTRAVTVAAIEGSARSTKLDAIEASADVTDLTNVNAAAATTVGTVTTGSWTATPVAQSYIASEAINEAKLQISNAGNNGEFLSKQTGDAGGLTWATVPAGYNAPTIGSTSIGSGATVASLAGLTNLTATGTLTSGQVNILAEGDLRLEDASGNEYVAVEAPATVGTSYTVKLPAAIGAAGEALKVTSISGTTQTMEWGTAGGANIVQTFSNTTTTGYTGTASSFGTVGVGDRDIYIKKIDTNNEGVFTKIWKNGAAVEVQIA